MIEAARTMLADSKLPTTFWAEAVNTACYVQNRVLIVHSKNKTPYELFRGRTPNLNFSGHLDVMSLYSTPLIIWASLIASLMKVILWAILWLAKL